MHGGVKFYRGHAAAARSYVEADHSRADDYYLAEGFGIAEHYVATRDPAGSIQVQATGALDGDAYEQWVAGYTTDGTPKGRLRKDDHALRFVEVVVNGPKTWSLAASVDPVISVAYDAAQDRAVGEIIGWLGEHSRTRVGPRGAQVQIPVEQIEAAVVRHYTSRAGDPHRHLHLQVNARVWAAGKWRGLHTAATRDSIEAINGIGHAAIACDPQFRAVLASCGYTLDPETSEIVELAPFAAKFSARAAQIARNTERFEAQWRTGHPGEEPGPAIRQAWDRRAWATARPDKVIPTSGADLVDRWRHELRDLGFTPPDPTPLLTAELGRPVWIRHPQPTIQPTILQAGGVERDAIAARVITQLGAGHSAWNAADIRGAVERHIAALGLVAEPSVRVELAEDITTRALTRCVPLLPDRARVPEHIRSLTSPAVLEVEHQITEHLAERGQMVGTFLVPSAAITEHCTHDQEIVVAALAGTAPLVVVEGAAGAGKTFTLRATRLALREHGSSRLLVVAPTLKAAQVAETELKAPAFSAAKLIHEYGYRWNDTTGERWREPVDPQTLPNNLKLRKDDLLIVDEAGMLDQDTTLALLEIADQQGARVAFIGDRHQLAAVGRGGVLDHAIRLAAPGNVVTLDSVHRVRDLTYARLTLEIRAGFHPEDTFSELLERGHIHIHTSEAERTAALTTAGLAGHTVIAESRETVAALNAHIQDAHHTQQPQQAQPAADANPPAYPDFSRLTTTPSAPRPARFETRTGQTLQVGDQVATRRNNPSLDVANRERWTITAINTARNTAGRGSSHPTITLSGVRGTRTVPGSYARTDLELAYATTVHGAQGETVDRAHFALTETSTAAATYVGLTRGRDSNTIHIVADNEDAARDQWMAAFNRDRCDLGPAHARNLALENLERHGNDWNGMPWTAGLPTTQRIRPNTTHISDRFLARLHQLDLLHPRGKEEPTRSTPSTEDHETTTSRHRHHYSRSGPSEGYGPSI
ncbi:MAG: hypothetical protein NVSMB48_04450 [Marmoricola sp.]